MSCSIHETQKTLRTVYRSKGEIASLTADDPVMKELIQKRRIKKSVREARKTTKLMSAAERKKEPIQQPQQQRP